MNSSTEANRSVSPNGSRQAHGLRLAHPTPEYARAETEVPDLAAESRIEALRLLVLAFLREVDSLKKTLASHKRKKRELTNLDQEVDAFEASLIREALIMSNGKQRNAARLLKVKPSTLHAKMKRLGIEVETTLTSVGR